MVSDDDVWKQVKALRRERRRLLRLNNDLLHRCIQWILRRTCKRRRRNDDDESDDDEYNTRDHNQTDRADSSNHEATQYTDDDDEDEDDRRHDNIRSYFRGRQPRHDAKDDSSQEDELACETQSIIAVPSYEIDELDV